MELHPGTEAVSIRRWMAGPAVHLLASDRFAGDVVSQRDVNGVIETVWRMESPRIIAGLARALGDVGLAEDAAQDALVRALETWPRSGVPANPAAWLTTVARRRAIDHLRRGQVNARKAEELARQELERSGWAEPDTAAVFDDDPIEDDLLRLIFTCCHPILSREARVALTLRLLGGLTTEAVAHAFLTPVSTVAQRIVRAKRTLREAKVPIEAPEGADRAARLPSVLEVIYLIFNEGYAASAGDHWLRADLCNEALRLGRILAELLPQEAEVHGLVALMELQASRLRARVGPSGEPVLLLDQDRSRWDQLLIRRGMAALARAAALGGALGPYALQAAIAACHAMARTAEETDWHRIVALYDALAQVAPSPVVELNRAVAVGMAYGPEAGLELVDELVVHPLLREYHLLPSVRGDLLFKLGRFAEAHAEFIRAAGLTGNEPERRLLLKRAAEAAARDGAAGAAARDGVAGAAARAEAGQDPAAGD